MLTEALAEESTGLQKFKNYGQKQEIKIGNFFVRSTHSDKKKATIMLQFLPIYKNLNDQ